MGINIFRKEFKKDKDDKTCQSEIQCFAQCYYNRIYKGECSCDLKTIIIDNTGKCKNFLDRKEGIKLFHADSEQTLEIKND